MYQKEQLTKIASSVSSAYINALLALHRRLAREHVDWAVGGDLAEAFRTVQVEPNCVEIVTGKKGVVQIFLAVKELAPSGVYFQTQQLTRNAMVRGKEYPAYVRSYYFEFQLQGVRFKVHGDLQYRISSWDWGGKLEFTPEYIYLSGARTAVVPLQVNLEIYRALGWTDKAERIEAVLKDNNRLSERQRK